MWYEISAVRHLVLSQCTRVTDGQTDGQNYDSQDRPRICSRGKNYLLYIPERLSYFSINFFSRTFGTTHGYVQIHSSASANWHFVKNVLRARCGERHCDLRGLCVQVGEVGGCFVLHSSSASIDNTATTISVVDGLSSRRNNTTMVVTSPKDCRHVLAFYGRLTGTLATM